MSGKITNLTPIYVGYTIVVLALAAYSIVTLRGDRLYEAFDEHRWIEDVQWAHLAVAFLAQIVVSVRPPRREYEPRLIDLMGLIFAGGLLIRELNNYWEALDVYTAYHAVAFALVVGMVVLSVLLVVERKRLGVRLLSWPKPHWIRLYLWGFAGYVFAQLVGRLFKDLGIERVYWRVIEEGLELAAGTLFLFGGVEALRAVAQARKTESSAGA